jgi:hypothetical protein
MAHGGDEPGGRRMWLYVVAAALLLLPIGALSAAKGADNWCDSKLAAAGDGYENKRVSVSVLPPGVRCAGDIGSGRSESLWPINW